MRYSAVQRLGLYSLQYRAKGLNRIQGVGQTDIFNIALS